ncbi:hypothetical protein K501DRAFT_191579 [Backusella circina FSU 941]|nr:hypothetical protein K501DRAFT_191579 [Backusella circina FSU 941]
MEGYVPKQEKNRKAEPTNLKYETFNQIPRIFVGSRTHKQITQLVDELKENTTYRPRMTVLASREHLCVHPKVSKSSTKADDCNALLDKKKCIYAHNTHKIVRHSDLKTSKRVWDIEDLVKLGKSPQIRGCPYYASRKLYEGAEIIFCPYNYIIDPIIRSALDIQIKNAIVIIDEAHNIEDSSRQAGSFEVNENELKILTMELGQLVRGGVEAEAHNHMLYFIDSILGWIQDNDNEYSIKEYEQHVNVWSGTQLLEKLAQLGIKATTFDSTIKTAFKSVSAHATMVRREAEDANVDQRVADDLADGEVRIHQRKCVSNNGLSVLQALIMIIGFFFEEGKTYSFDYRMALIKKIERGGKKKGKMNKKAKTKVADLVVDPSEWNFKLCFWCLNPGAIFRQLTDDTHSVILTSGTLSPMNTFESELETKFAAKLEANHVISSSQVWVGTIPAGPNNISLKGTYTNMESFQYQDDLGEALYQILDVVPFGVLCFFSSYGTLDKLTERWKLTGIMEKMEKKKLILTEPRKSGKNDFEKMMKQYNDMICAVESDSNETSQTGALIFGVFRGKISEGIDFTDNTCRAVVSIGIPYPGL